jgi:hypothetical protein
MVEHYNTGTCTIRVGHDYVCLNFGSNSAASVSVQDRARELRAIGIDVEVVAADHALRVGAGRPWHGTNRASLSICSGLRDVLFCGGNCHSQ